MRFDTPVYFQTVTPGEYNAETANYNADAVTEVIKYASVTDTGVETLKTLFGKVKQGSLTIRLLRPYTAHFDRIYVANKIYTVDFAKLNKRVFIVSELKENAGN